MEDIRNMVLSFRVSELQTLLAYAGKPKIGKKTELQRRALELARYKQTHLITKIKELYKGTQMPLINAPTHTVTSSSMQSGSSSNSANNRYYNYSCGYPGGHDNVLQGRSAFSHYYSATDNSNKVQNNNISYALPICPDVKIKKLPFYDIQCELMKPTSLISSGPVSMQESTYPFYLTPQQAADIASSKELLGGSMYPSEQKIGYQLQVQLRFCVLDSSGEQADSFPPSICVRVNGKIVPLPTPIPSHRPGVEGKRPSAPLNVTNYVKLSPSCANTIGITWVSDPLGRGWAMCLHLVKKVTSTDLLARLKLKGPRPSEFTRGMIKEIVSKDDGDCQIAMTSLKVSTACPLGKCRMSLPCRASTCSHLQCFDANLFLQMNEKKPTWNCPVCDKPLQFDNLAIDGYFQQVINSLPFDANNEIEVLPDGSWSPICVVKKERMDGPPTKRARSEAVLDNTICLDDEIIIDSPTPVDSIVEKPNTENNNASASKSVEYVDLTLSDSEEEAQEEEEDEEEEEILAVHIRRKPPRIVDETSSSSSSSSSTSSSSSSCSSTSTNSTTFSNKSAKPEAQPEPQKASHSSPTVITLDSPSMSPQPCEDTPAENSAAQSSTTTTTTATTTTNNNNIQNSNVFPSTWSGIPPTSASDSDDSRDWLFNDFIPQLSKETFSNPASAAPPPTPTTPPPTNMFANPAYTGQQSTVGVGLDARNTWDPSFSVNDAGGLNFGAFDYLDYDQFYGSNSNASHLDYSNIW